MTIDFEKDGTVQTVRPEGRIDAVTAPELEKQLTPQLEGISDLIFDLKAVTYISSAGLRILLAAELAMEKRAGSIKIIHPSPYVLEILEMTGFSDMVAVEGD
jgi:anti-sigma B factor antagonist